MTNITDLGRYAQALATGALLPAGNDRFAAPVPVGGDQPTWFTSAGGAFQAGFADRAIRSMPGYLVGAFADPTTGMSVAVVLNNSGGDKTTGAWLAGARGDRLEGPAARADRTPGGVAVDRRADARQHQQQGHLRRSRRMTRR